MSKCFLVDKKNITPQLLKLPNSSSSSMSLIKIFSSGLYYTLFVTTTNKLYILTTNKNKNSNKKYIIKEIIINKKKIHLCKFCQKEETEYQCIISDIFICEKCNVKKLLKIRKKKKNNNNDDDYISHVKCGDYHSFIVFDNEEIYVFGKNISGQLGIGHQFQIEVPIIGPILNSSVKMIGCGASHSVIITNNKKKFEDFDEIFVMGLGRHGQLGNGKRYNSDRSDDHNGNCICELKPVKITSKVLKDKRFKLISCGKNFNLIVTDENEVFAFGEGKNGQLGTGNQNSIFPKKLTVGSGLWDNENIISVSAGDFHSIICTESNVYVSGLNSAFQLGFEGDNNMIYKFTKIEIPDFKYSRIITCCCGSFHTCIVTTQSLYETIDKNKEKKKNIFRIYSFGEGLRKLSESRYIETEKKINKLTSQKNIYFFLAE